MMSPHDADEASSKPREREMQPPGSYYGSPGYIGNTIYARRGDVAEYLSAWGPGGWSREHGLEHHGRPMERYPRGQYDRGYRSGQEGQSRRPPWYDDGAPTG